MAENIQIFLSYAREDQKEVNSIYERLKVEGFKPWMDIHDIIGGEKWEFSIKKAIKSSDFFMACLTPNSVSKRGILQKEVKDALEIWQEKFESDIYLIPVRLEKCNIPEGLKEFHCLNLFENDGWGKVLESLREGIKRTGKNLAFLRESLLESNTEPNRNSSNQTSSTTVKSEDLVLIVFTDEKGSVSKDVRCRTPKQILDARASLFSSQIKNLSTDGWLVLKNVGDQLVLRYDGNHTNTDLKQKVASCLKNLYDAWNSRELKGTLRIAVHSPDIDKKRFAIGEDIIKYLLPELYKTLQEVGGIWPSSEHLNEDIFGYEMNLAARLVTITKGALFLISEKVVELCGEDFLRICISEWGSGLSEKIPLINIRGFEEEFTEENPFYVREINDLYKKKEKK